MGCPGKTKKLSSLPLLGNNSKAGEPFSGIHVELDFYVETSDGISWFSFLIYHLHLIFLVNSSKSLCKSTSLINYGAGEKHKLFSRALISVLNYTFLLRLNTDSEEKESLMRSLSGSKRLSLLTTSEWRVSSNESSPCLRLCEDSLTLSEAETGGGTYAGA